jgi:hypothetical protein
VGGEREKVVCTGPRRGGERDEGLEGERGELINMKVSKYFNWLRLAVPRRHAHVTGVTWVFPCCISTSVAFHSQNYDLSANRKLMLNSELL